MATKISIGIDVRKADGKGAGKSRYCLEITKALIAVAPKNVEFKLYTKKPTPLLPNTKMARQICVSGKSIFWHWKLRGQLRKHPVDCFIAPTSTIYPAIAPRSQQTLTVIHDLIALLHSKGHHWFPVLVEKLTVKRALKRSDQLVTISSATLKDLHRLFPFTTHKKITIAPPAVSPEFTKSKTHSLDLPKKFLLFVGTIHPRKNLSTLLESFAQYLAQDDPQLQLCIAGAMGWKSAGLLDDIPEELHDRIHFLGRVSDEALIELYSRAHALIFLSTYEGFGMPILEAMACGCPVITSNVSSMPEVAADAALCIDPSNPKALKKALTRLQKERAQLIKKGRQRAKDFSWEASARAILDAVLQ